ncbi:MAG: hypothetical protein QM387_00915 [Spirochaetota bacterium]|nr:hypothetical protein [Spirochaetota bacterium]
MNNEKIKQILLSIQESSIEFAVTMSGKASKKVNGLYNPETKEIILHNKNFQNDNQLIYTAIHEYTHHILNEELLERTQGLGKMKSARSHTNEFWARFHSLLEVAEKKGFYTIAIETSPELQALTETIKKDYLEKNALLMSEFGKLLLEAHALCLKENIRYEDYIDRVLQIPRTEAKNIVKISSANFKPEIGFENMKMLAKIGNSEKREAAESQLLQGKSPDSVKSFVRAKPEALDIKEELIKERGRIEKTIDQLSNRLDQINANLSVL